MGVRYEWHDRPSVEYIPPGCDVSTGQLADEETPYERLAENGALVISSDEAAVITGDLDLFVRRILSAMHRPSEGPAYRPEVFYRLLYHGSPVHSGWDRAEIDQVLEGRVNSGYTREDHKIQSRRRWTITSPWSEVRR